MKHISIKYLIILSTIIYQSTTFAQSKPSVIIITNDVLDPNKTRHLDSNIEQSIRDTLETGIKDLYKTLTETPQKQWYSLRTNAYYSFFNEFYSYIKKLITKL